MARIGDTFGIVFTAFTSTLENRAREELMQLGDDFSAQLEPRFWLEVDRSRVCVGFPDDYARIVSIAKGKVRFIEPMLAVAVTKLTGNVTNAIVGAATITSSRTEIPCETVRLPSRSGF